MKLTLACILTLLGLCITSGTMRGQTILSNVVQEQGELFDQHQQRYTVNTARLSSLSGVTLVKIINLPVGINERRSVLLKRRCANLLSRTEIHAATMAGEVRIAAPRLEFFEGTILGEEGSKIMFAYASGFLFYAVTRADGKRLTFGPDRRNPSQSILIGDEDLLASGPLHPFNCLTGGVPDRPRCAAGSPVAAKPPSSRLLELEVAVEADNLFFANAGNSVPSVLAYIATLYGMVSAQYEDEVGVTLSLNWVKLWTSHDPYNVGGNAYILMDTARAYWKIHYADVKRDVAHVMTSIGYGGGGFAYYSLCDNDQSFGVSSPQTGHSYPTYSFTYDAYIVAHEIGHNFGAPHSHDCWWNPPLDTCWTKDDPNLSLGDACYSKPITPRPNAGSIMSYCASANYRLSNNDFSKYRSEMKFTPRVAAFMRSTAESASCLTEPSAPTLILVDPRGGAEVTAGDSMTFRWLESNVTNIKLEYSPDAFVNWIPLWEGLADQAAARVQLPAVTSSRLWFRILDKDHPATADTTLLVMSISAGLSARIPNLETLSVFPNPASEQLTVALPGGLIDDRYEIIDALGRVVWSGAIGKGAIDVSALRPGAYSLRPTSNAASSASFLVVR